MLAIGLADAVAGAVVVLRAFATYAPTKIVPALLALTVGVPVAADSIETDLSGAALHSVFDSRPTFRRIYRPALPAGI